MTDRPTDQVNYILDAYKYKKYLQKISAVYLENNVFQIVFLTDRRTFPIIDYLSYKKLRAVIVLAVVIREL